MTAHTTVASLSRMMVKNTTRTDSIEGKHLQLKVSQIISIPIYKNNGVLGFWGFGVHWGFIH